MRKNKKMSPKDAKWAKAKKLCRLNTEDIRKAKELGFKPKSLIKNIPDKSKLWKAPVKIWIRELYEKKFGDSKSKSINKPGPKKKSKPPIEEPSHDKYEPLSHEIYDDEIPF